MLTAIARFVLLRGEPVWRRLGIDVHAVLAIVEAKLLADRRRVPPSFGAVRQNRSRNWFLWQVVLYAFVGLVLSILLLVSQSMFAGAMVSHTGIMVLIALAVLSDFSTVLLDTTDNSVLEPRPLTKRTILAARLLHVVLYVGAIVAALGTASWVLAGVKYGVRGFVGFGLALGADMALVMGLVTLLFLSSMRFFSSRYLKTVILWAQIAATLIFLFGFQLMPQLLGVDRLDGITAQKDVWLLFYPPAWMSGLSLLGGPGRLWMLAVLGAVVPLTVLAGAYWLSSGFRPAVLRDPDPIDAPSLSAKKPWPERLARWVTGNRIEAAYFAWVWRQVSRETAFKLRVYPSLVMSLVFPPLFLFVLPQGEDGEGRLESFRSQDVDLFVLYFASLSLLGCLLMIRITDRPEARWIHEACPVPRPGDALVAALKVILIRFELPVYLVTAGLVLGVWGLGRLGDVVLAGTALFTMATFEAFLLGRRLPFSEPASPQSSSNGAILGLGMLAIPTAFGLMHYQLRLFPGLPAAAWRPWIAAPIVALVGAVVLRAYRRLSWRSVRPR